MKETKLYNLIFPVWLLWVFPITWLVILPANFMIDLLVVVLTMKFMKVEGIKQKAKVVILRVWGFGFLSDFIGTIGMLLAMLMDYDTQTKWGSWWYEYITSAVSYDPFYSIYSVLWITVCVLIAGICIYYFNLKWGLKKANLEFKQRKAVALSLAIITAPYLFYLPTKWFF